MRDQCANVPADLFHSSHSVGLIDDPMQGGIPPTEPPPEPDDPDDPKKPAPVKPPKKEADP